jgi:hypothetical protein
MGDARAFFDCDLAALIVARHEQRLVEIRAEFDRAVAAKHNVREARLEAEAAIDRALLELELAFVAAAAAGKVRQ